MQADIIRHVRWIALLGVFMTLTAHGADTPPTAGLTAVYDRFNAAIKAGDLKTAVSLRTKEFQTKYGAEIREPKGGKSYLEDLRPLTPVSYKVKDSKLDGKSAEMFMLATLPKNPRDKDAPAQMIIGVEFAQEGGEWKMGTISYMSAK
jgi:hypothetical protein